MAMAGSLLEAPVLVVVLLLSTTAFVSTASGKLSPAVTTVPEACAKTHFPKLCQQGLMESDDESGTGPKQQLFTTFSLVASYLNVMDTAAADDVAYVKGVIAGKAPAAAAAAKNTKCLDTCLAALEAAAARIHDANVQAMSTTKREEFRAWASAVNRGKGVCAGDPSCTEFYVKGRADKDEFVKRISTLDKMFRIIMDLFTVDADATRAAEKDPAYGTLPSP